MYYMYVVKHTVRQHTDPKARARPRGSLYEGNPSCGCETSGSNDGARVSNPPPIRIRTSSGRWACRPGRRRGGAGARQVPACTYSHIYIYIYIYMRRMYSMPVSRKAPTRVVGAAHVSCPEDFSTRLLFNPRLTYPSQLDLPPRFIS